MEEITQGAQPTFEEVKDELESWRANKTNHRQPIPKELWQAAADLKFGEEPNFLNLNFIAYK